MKYGCNIGGLAFVAVLPLTREWIEICNPWVASYGLGFSLLRGSGLKSGVARDISRVQAVLPLTREWIEISRKFWAAISGVGSPSYEGVD